jgi:membrane associated rhomboid family serine protease
VTQKPASEPIFNVPTVVSATIALLVLVHGVRELVLSPMDDRHFLLLFAFIPARFEASVLGPVWPGGLAADIWTFVSYSAIHGDLMHLGINVFWLLAFGSPVARRFGAWRYLAFFAATAAAGAALHLAMHMGDRVVMVGASAAISGFMAAAMRFAFQPNAPLGLFGSNEPEAYRVPAAPLGAMLRDGRVLAFIIVWFGINLLFGLGSMSMDGGQQAIAWEAHIGGFLAGLIAFPLFDPVGRAKRHDHAAVPAERREDS